MNSETAGANGRWQEQPAQEAAKLNEALRQSLAAGRTNRLRDLGVDAGGGVAGHGKANVCK
jgi:hypothetical protein